MNVRRHCCRPRQMAAVGRVSRAPHELSGARNCTRDEGGPFEFGDQEPISSHRKLLRAKAVVVRVAETPRPDFGRHGRERRAQANRCRSVESGLGDVRTGGDPSSGISSGDALILPERHPAYRRREARPGFRMNVRTCASSRQPCEGTSRNRLQPRGREYRSGAQGRSSP